MSKLVNIGEGNWFEALALVEEFFKESPLFSKLGYDPQMVINELAATIAQPQRFGKIGYIGDEPAGLVMARRVECLFRGGTIAQDIMFYIRPKFRATLLVKRLITAYQEWAWGEPDCLLVQLTSLAGRDNERAARLGQHLGFGTVGHVLVKERS